MSYKMTGSALDNGSIGYISQKPNKNLIIYTPGMASGPVSIFGHHIAEEVCSSPAINADVILYAPHTGETFKDYNLEKHRGDLQRNINELAKNYEKIILIANSASCVPAMEVAHKKLVQSIFILPALNLKAGWEVTKSNAIEIADDLKISTTFSFVPVAYHPQMEEEGLQIDKENAKIRLEMYTGCPILALNGENDPYYDKSLIYPACSESKVVKGFGHSFSQLGACKAFYAEVEPVLLKHFSD